MIRLMYEGTRTKVISPDGETELFYILAGVLLGETLASYLMINYCMIGKPPMEMTKSFDSYLNTGKVAEF